VKFEVQRLTPPIAARLLQKNKNIRPLSRTTVENLKEAFVRGEYVMSHQGIAFVGDDLVDGQHRLTAISEMPPNFSVEMLVCRQVDPRAVKVMDIGKKRVAADILGEDRKLVECARFLATVYVAKANSVTPTFLVPFVERLRAPHAELMDFCPTACKMWSSAPVRAAACMVSIAGGDMDYAKLVYRAMVSQDFTTMPRSAQAVFRAHLNGKVRAGHASDAFVRALKIFNPENASLTKIQVKDTSSALEAVRQVLRRQVFHAEKQKTNGKAEPATAGLPHVLQQRQPFSNYGLSGI
jgi:hypothetical protein